VRAAAHTHTHNDTIASILSPKVSLVSLKGGSR
jgi:hypothetical protein